MNTIQHTCGHASSWPDTEPHRDAKLRTQRCPHCRKTSGRERYLAKVQAAQQEANEHGWPAMTGTQRAANWAAVLRSEALAAYRNACTGPNGSIPPELTEHYAHVLTRETRAHRWIDDWGPNTPDKGIVALLRKWATNTDIHQARSILRSTQGAPQ